MSLSSHLTELRKKHQALSDVIETEQRHPGSDDLSIKQLKLRKLHLKEEIQRLEAAQA
ncbi:YdcH family protein [Amaricoccus sp. W119]|uniref:YdcH family protein n=1 Tax=Amaricoccus sp. W119 TaxID=3391833 RepID=UPI0039A47CC7